MRRILNICPIGEDPLVESQVKLYLEKFCRSDTEIEVRSLGKAPMDLEYLFHETLIAVDMLRLVKVAEKEGFDAAIVGCFYDPYLDAAKEICEKMVIVGPGEASLHFAATLSNRFSIIAPSKKTVPHMWGTVKKNRFTEYLASVHSLDVPVVDLLDNPTLIYDKMCQEIEVAISKYHAEAIILGCTLELGHFFDLQNKYGLPIIDVSLAALKYAECLIDLREAFGWYTSKIGEFSSPPFENLKKWGLEDKYGMKGLF